MSFLFFSLRVNRLSSWSSLERWRSTMFLCFSEISFSSLPIWLTISLSFFLASRSSALILPELILESRSFWFFSSISFTYFLFSIWSWWKSMNLSSSPISSFLVIWLAVLTIWADSVAFLFLYFSISALFCRSFSSKNFSIRSASMFPVRLFSPPIRISRWKSYASLRISAIAMSVSSRMARRVSRMASDLILPFSMVSLRASASCWAISYFSSGERQRLAFFSSFFFSFPRFFSSSSLFAYSFSRRMKYDSNRQFSRRMCSMSLKQLSNC